jgi:hypothetical protein
MNSLSSSKIFTEFNFERSKVNIVTQTEKSISMYIIKDFNKNICLNTISGGDAVPFPPPTPHLLNVAPNILTSPRVDFTDFEYLMGWMG